MAKDKITYKCSKCGNVEPQWFGKCCKCNSFGTFNEDIFKKEPYSYKKKPTGEKVIFEEIWQERDKKSFLSGVDLRLFEDKWVNLFAHVLAKGKAKYPKFKLYKKNIILLTPQEHMLLDHGTKEMRKKYAEEYLVDWSRIQLLKLELIEEYKNL